MDTLGVLVVSRCQWVRLLRDHGGCTVIRWNIGLLTLSLIDIVCLGEVPGKRTLGTFRLMHNWRGSVFLRLFFFGPWGIFGVRWLL